MKAQKTQHQKETPEVDPRGAELKSPALTQLQGKSFPMLEKPIPPNLQKLIDQLRKLQRGQ